jgi:hypothetical protein
LRHLFAADRVRFGRRRDLWILVALVPVILSLMFVTDFNGVTTPPQFDFFLDPPDPVQEAELRAQTLAEWRQRMLTQVPAFAFPASLLRVAGNFVPVILLSVYLATALVAGEFEWGTVRTMHLTSSRGRTLAVRVGVVGIMIFIVVALGLAAATVIPFLLSVEGAPLQGYAAAVPDFWAELANRIVVLVPFIAIPVLMAVVARSIGAAFLLTLLFFVADLAITGAPIWVTSPAPWVPAVTVAGSVSRLIGGDDSMQALIAPAAVSFGALLAWAVVPVAAAIAWFRRIDLNE